MTLSAEGRGDPTRSWGERAAGGMCGSWGRKHGGMLCGIRLGELTLVGSSWWAGVGDINERPEPAKCGIASRAELERARDMDDGLCGDIGMGRW